MSLSTFEATKLYPLEFIPIGKEKIWGGNYLANNMLKPFSNTKPIGESWELSDIEGSESIVAHGELKGKSIKDIISLYGYENIVGKKLDDGNIFPLLIKYIEANDNLSIQVHPNDEYAMKHLCGYGKTEMWVVLDTTKEDAKILVGLNKNISKADLKKAIENKQNIENMFNYINVKKGDALYIPAGRVHAILSGVIIAEIQQASDTTFRLYDWERVYDSGVGRELHIEESFNVIDDRDSEPLSLNDNWQDVNGYEYSHLITNDYFDTSKILLKESTTYKPLTDGTFEIIMLLSGSIVIGSGDFEREYKMGSTILLPSSLRDVAIKNIYSQNAIFLSIKR